MLAYTLRRIAGLVPTLFVLVTLSFFIIRLAPGGPFDQEQALARRDPREPRRGLRPRSAAARRNTGATSPAWSAAISVRRSGTRTSASPS